MKTMGRVRIPGAALLYFILVFGAGFLMGIIRVGLVEPRVGVRYAELLEMPVMLLVVILAARYSVRRFALENSVMSRLAVGLLALAMLLIAEFSLAAGLRNLDPAGYIASRDPVSGTVYLAMLGLFGLMPVILFRRRGKPSEDAALKNKSIRIPE